MSEDGAARLEAGRVLLGLRLREARMAAELSLPQVAELTGLSMGHLSDCERGRTLPSLPALLGMSSAYGVLVTDILEGVYPFGSTSRPRRLPSPPPDGRSTRHQR